MKIRNASLDDSTYILDWRNDDLARKNSFNRLLISKDEHENWLRTALSDSRYYIYIIENNRENLAVVIFYQVSECRFKVSINVNPIFRGKNLARSILLLAEKRFSKAIDKTLKINILILEAKIINHNIVSKKLFYSLDFKTEVNNDDHTIMVKELNLLKKI